MAVAVIAAYGSLSWSSCLFVAVVAMAMATTTVAAAAVTTAIVVAVAVVAVATTTAVATTMAVATTTVVAITMAVATAANSTPKEPEQSRLFGFFSYFRSNSTISPSVIKISTQLSWYSLGTLSQSSVSRQSPTVVPEKSSKNLS